MFDVHKLNYFLRESEALVDDLVRPSKTSDSRGTTSHHPPRVRVTTLGLGSPGIGVTTLGSGSTGVRVTTLGLGSPGVRVTRAQGHSSLWQCDLSNCLLSKIISKDTQ